MSIDVGQRIGQAGAPHGPMKLGLGKRTFTQSGCLFVCLVGVARALVGPKDLQVLDAHTAVLDAGTDAEPTFLGSGLFVGRAANALGLELVARRAPSWPLVRAEIAAGRPVIFGVDYKDGASSGFSDADHFVLAVDTPMNTFIVCMDPGAKSTLILDVEAPIYRGRPAVVSEILCFRSLASA